MIYYFASVDENNFVNAVHMISHENCLDENNSFNENKAIEYLNNFHGQSRWIQTSKDGSIRYNFAGIGSYYYEEYDAFIGPKPSDNAILTENFAWIVIDDAQFLEAINID